MKTRSLFSSLLIGLQFLGTSASAQGNGHGEYRPGEIVCEMLTGYDINFINLTYGTSLKAVLSQTGSYLLQAPGGADAESLATVIAQQQAATVLYCGANYYLDAPEPFQRSSPFLDNNLVGSFESQTAAVDLELAAALTISTGTGVTVGVFDTGINTAHPIFTAKTGGSISGWDFVDDDSVAFDEPGGHASGHGTFVCGLIHLVAPDANIKIYRVLDTLGRGDGWSLARAIVRAVEDGCGVINLSLGMRGVNEALDDALKFAHDNDVVIVAAAGNDSTNSNTVFPFPADQSYAIAIAAVDSNDILAPFSNYGGKIDLCAPGVNTYSPFLDTIYAWWDGTSFAAPFVSGAAALLRSKNATLTHSQVREILSETAIDIDSLNPSFAGGLGKGLIDIVAALQYTIGYKCGDPDRNDSISIADAVFLINYIFSGGPAPLPIQSGDADCSGRINIGDCVYLISYIFSGGGIPCQNCP